MYVAHMNTLDVVIYQRDLETEDKDREIPLDIGSGIRDKGSGVDT